MTLGVVVGKFLPLHRGHQHLLASAQRACDQLVVIVADKVGQCVPGDVRGAWIRELFPTAEVVVVPDDIPDETAAWVARTREILQGRACDLVFSSETYGVAFARGLGARSILVDLERRTIPASGTSLRADLAAHWADLTSPAKAWFARRVVVVGVESSGTTTLARALAASLGTSWVPEYGRTYWEGRQPSPGSDSWTEEEFLGIARIQRACEEHLARRAERVLVCDTDALATAAWHWRYRGDRSARLEALARDWRPDLYLLTKPDFPFVQDGTREGERIRHAMHEVLKSLLIASGCPYVALGGTHDARMRTALDAVRPLLHFAPL